MSPPSDPSGERELTVRVVLGTSRVALKIPGAAPLALDESELTGLFRLGLLLGRPPGDDAAPAGELRAKGEVRFLVGRVDLGTRAGLRAVRDGLEYALNSALRDVKYPTPAARPSTEDAAAKPAPPAGAEEAPVQAAGPVQDRGASAYRAAVSQEPSWPPDEFVEEDEFAADIDAWLSRADQGRQITITRSGRPLANMVSFARYRTESERHAWIQTAYWRSWEGGRFDPAKFVDLVDSEITPPGELSTRPLLDDDEEDSDAGTG